MQSSREIVSRAIHFEKSERLPMEFERFGVCDVQVAKWDQFLPWNVEGRENYDEWGCLWVRTDQNDMGQVKGHPLRQWRDLKSQKWPDPDDEAFYAGMEEKLKEAGNRYVRTGIFMVLWERMHSLRGFEAALMDFYLQRSKLEELADRIVEFDLRIIENISRLFPDQIHGIDFSDDWGTEQSTIISVELWNEFFKPRYETIFNACKAAGWDVWLHSCGKINAFIPVLIEIGCDVLNLQQPRTNGIKETGQRFAGKICFSSLCDIQYTLPFGSAEEIEEEAKELIDNWGTDDGGFILSDDGNEAATGTDIEKKKVMFHAFQKCDRWRK